MIPTGLVFEQWRRSVLYSNFSEVIRLSNVIKGYYSLEHSVPCRRYASKNACRPAFAPESTGAP